MPPTNISPRIPASDYDFSTSSKVLAQEGEIGLHPESSQNTSASASGTAAETHASPSGISTDIPLADV